MNMRLTVSKYHKLLIFVSGMSVLGIMMGLGATEIEIRQCYGSDNATCLQKPMSAKRIEGAISGMFAGGGSAIAAGFKAKRQYKK